MHQQIDAANGATPFTRNERPFYPKMMVYFLSSKFMIRFPRPPPASKE